MTAQPMLVAAGCFIRNDNRRKSENLVGEGSVDKPYGATSPPEAERIKYRFAFYESYAASLIAKEKKAGKNSRNTRPSTISPCSYIISLCPAPISGCPFPVSRPSYHISLWPASISRRYY